MIKQWLKKEGIYFIKMFSTFAVLGVLAVLLSQLLAGVLQERELLMVENEEVLPATVLELIGMQQLQVFAPELEIFFIIMMVTNLIIMGAIIGHSVHSVRESIEKGALSFYYVQVMKSWQYFAITVLRVVGSALVLWLAYVIEMMLAGVILCACNPALTGEEIVLTVLLEMAWTGIPVVLLMSSAGMLYGIKQGYSMHGVDYGLCILGISFLIGNIYKIPQYVGQMQIDEMTNAQEMMNLAYQLKQIRWICPFAWVNPYNIYHSVLGQGMLWGYLGVAILILIVTGVVFSKRDWWEL